MLEEIKRALSQPDLLVSNKQWREWCEWLVDANEVMEYEIDGLYEDIRNMDETRK